MTACNLLSDSLADRWRIKAGLGKPSSQTNRFLRIVSAIVAPAKLKLLLAERLGFSPIETRESRASLRVSKRLKVDVGAQHGRAVCRGDGGIHRATGNIFKLLVTELFRFLDFFAHSRSSYPLHAKQAAIE